METDGIAVRIGGQAGDGALSTGDTLAKVLHRMGYFVSTYSDFPSQIRAIHTNYTIRGSKKPYFARPDKLNFLLAFDKDSVIRHPHELAEKGIILMEKDLNSKDALERDDILYLEIPFNQLARHKIGNPLMKNTLALGVLGYFIELPRDIIKLMIEERFLKAKGKEVVDKNLSAFDIGWKYAEENFSKVTRTVKLSQEKREERLLILGNEAIALGALLAGCRFYAGYPITPASEILEFLAKILPKHNGVVIQAEDEIAAINFAIGAGAAGARAMTASSGPGIALMTEGISYAGMTEIPVVIVDCQRAGPSTGMPTKHEQGDLFDIVFGGHGDFPRIVLSPSDCEDAFYITVSAFNLAEKYQCPVFILTDQFLAQNAFTTKKFDFNKVHIDRGKLTFNPDDNFKRYEFTDDCISPRTIFGIEKGIHHITGVEHTEKGTITTYAKIRKRMMEKRMAKLNITKHDFPSPLVIDSSSSSAKKVIFTWGSTRLPLTEAIENLEKSPYRVVALRTLWPMDTENIHKLSEDVDDIIVVEHNLQGQLAFLLEKILKRDIRKILKYKGRPFMPREILQRLKEEDL